MIEKLSVLKAEVDMNCNTCKYLVRVAYRDAGGMLKGLCRALARPETHNRLTFHPTDPMTPDNEQCYVHRERRSLVM